MLSIFQGKEHLAPAPQSIDLIRGLVGGTLNYFNPDFPQ